jgi:hypothetical protein
MGVHGIFCFSVSFVLFCDGGLGLRRCYLFLQWEGFFYLNWESFLFFLRAFSPPAFPTLPLPFGSSSFDGAIVHSIWGYWGKEEEKKETMK